MPETVEPRSAEPRRRGAGQRGRLSLRARSARLAPSRASLRSWARVPKPHRAL